MSRTTLGWVVRHSPTRGAERLVLVVLADHADHVGRSFPSLARLAQHTHLAWPTVGRVVRRLERYQHIDTCRAPGPTTTYTVVVDPRRVGRPRQPEEQ